MFPTPKKSRFMGHALQPPRERIQTIMAKAAAKRSPRRKQKTEPVGLTPAETREAPSADAAALARAIEEDGGAALAVYREPLGGKWVILAALPLGQVEPTPYQRGLSDAHVKRLADAIGKTGRYLDPVIAFRVEPKRYQTPNGHHRASALKRIGARTVTALVVTEPEVARLILALNVEKAHALREKCLEAIKLARELAKLPAEKESAYALEFESPAFLTLGICYEQRPRFAGGAYHFLIRRAEAFLDKPLPKALEAREDRAKALLAIDDRVTELVAALKARGLESPYLRSFVTARLNTLRFRPDATLSVEEVLEKAAEAAKKFDPAKINVGDLARSAAASGGGGEGQE
jgi:ParB family chromosome partitioning protein